LRALLGFDGKRVIAYVGRKEEQKRYFDFLRALESLSRKRVDVRGIAAGALPPRVMRDASCVGNLERASRLAARSILFDLPRFLTTICHACFR
jgi:glycosyltransferase involved in cell wall biosynthesis